MPSWERSTFFSTSSEHISGQQLKSQEPDYEAFSSWKKIAALAVSTWDRTQKTFVKSSSPEGIFFSKLFYLWMVWALCFFVTSIAYLPRTIHWFSIPHLQDRPEIILKHWKHNKTGGLYFICTDKNSSCSLNFLIKFIFNDDDTVTF